jgi:hypothetical protein
LSSQTSIDYKSPLDLATDIQKVTYYSDGKNLNATLWLGNKTITDPSKFGTVVLLYGALFDIDKNPATGKFGVDFQHEIQWNNYSKEWNSFIVEQSSKDYFRTVFSRELHRNSRQCQFRIDVSKLKIFNIEKPIPTTCNTRSPSESL